MAHLVTLYLLIDESAPYVGNEAVVTDGLNEMLRTSQEPVDPENPDETPFVVDWAFGEIRPIPPELHDSIVNETYEEGEFTNFMQLGDKP